ncbi:GNAT family N-acetyltransferase [Acidisoma sp. 7E03]
MDATIRDSIEGDNPTLACAMRELMSKARYPEFSPDAPDEVALKDIKGCKTLVLEIEGKVVGMISVSTIDLSARGISNLRNMAFVMAFWIDVCHRRKGYGRALFLEFRKWAEQEDIDIINLAVEADNNSARAFYLKLGLQETSLQMAVHLKEGRA